MDDKTLKDAFSNRTKIESAERICCDNCNIQMIFHLRDSENRDFSLGLPAVLNCIVAAIQTGNLPKLPLSWLADADFVCGTFFADDERNYYSDSNFPRRRE